MLVVWPLIHVQAIHPLRTFHAILSFVLGFAGTLASPILGFDHLKECSVYLIIVVVHVHDLLVVGIKNVSQVLVQNTYIFLVI